MVLHYSCKSLKTYSLQSSRLFESLCSSDCSNQFPSELRAPDDDDDEVRSGMSSVASLAGSRTSSQWSLVKGVVGELDEEVIVSLVKLLMRIFVSCCLLYCTRWF